MTHVLILTSDAGFGHRHAADAVRRVLEEQHDCTVTTANPMQHDETPGLIQRLEQTYSDRVTDQSNFYKVTYDLIDTPLMTEVVREGMAQILQDAMLSLLRTHQPDVILSTYPMYAEPTLAAFEEYDKRLPVGVVITDLGEVQTLWYCPDVDRHYAPTETVRQQAIENDVPPERVIVTGLPVDPAFSRVGRSQVEIREAHDWQPAMPTALIIGGPRSTTTAEIVEALQPGDLQQIVIAGGDDALYEKLAEMSLNSHTHLYNWVEDMPQFIHAADFVITKAGGVIVSEVLAAGRPIIVAEALPGQEIGNAAHIAENGAGVWPDDVDGVAQAARQWAAEGHVTFTTQAKTLGKPEASATIAQDLMALV